VTRYQEREDRTGRQAHDRWSRQRGGRSGAEETDVRRSKLEMRKIQKNGRSHTVHPI
jgi:hypothetical protein